MKTLAGGKQGNLKQFVGERLSYSYGAVSWILANKHIDCTTLTMDNYAMVEILWPPQGRNSNAPTWPYSKNTGM